MPPFGQSPSNADLTGVQAQITALGSKIPAQAVSAASLMYANKVPVNVNTTVPTLVFDGGSAARTFAANTLTPGKSFRLQGGGIFSTPAGNLLTASIILKVGGATIVSVTTGNAPVATNESADFKCMCTVQPNGTSMICTGQFSFVVLGGTYVPVPFNSKTAVTFDPTVPNTVDLYGDWNGTVTSQSCVVQTLSLEVLN